MEPLFDPENDRTRLLPIKYQDLWEAYQNAKASFWVPEEIDFRQDLCDWETLTPEQRQFLEMNFAFFSVFDQIVIKNLDDFISQVTIPEAKFFYRFQAMMEDIHVHTYTLFPELFVKDEKRKSELFDAVKSFPVIGSMAAWAKKWIDTNSFVHRLLAFIIVEGIFFSGAFASIFYMKKQGKMPGIAQANEFIARDEGMHRDFGIMLYHYLNDKLPFSEVKSMIDEATNLAIEFNTTALQTNLIGMNSDMMRQYILFVADDLSQSLLGRKIYNVANPFPWMTLISLQTKPNFFDVKGANYARQAVLTAPDSQQIRFDAEF